MFSFVLVRMLCRHLRKYFSKKTYKINKKKDIIDFFIYICRPKCENYRLNIDY